MPVKSMFKSKGRKERDDSSSNDPANTSRQVEVFTNEFEVGGDPDVLGFSTTELAYVVSDGRREVITYDEIENVEQDVDKSIAGFKVVAGAFALPGLYFMWRSIIFLITGAPWNLFTVGSYISAILLLWATVIFYNMSKGAGTIDVLTIKTEDSTYEFLTQAGNGDFGNIPDNYIKLLSD